MNSRLHRPRPRRPRLAVSAALLCASLCACSPDNARNTAADTASDTAAERSGAIAPPAATSPAEATAAIRSDQVRLRQHFDTVLADLRAADTGHLGADQRAARAEHIAELQRYRDRGLYPHNHDFAGRLPYFVDEHGTRCALGHLIEESGGGDLVERIAATDNHAYVADLRGDPELVAWLDGAGLSAAEAARIQPQYCNGFPGECPPETDISAGYGTASVIVGATNAASVVLNFRPSGRKRGWFGVAAGTIGMGLGLAKLDEDGAVQMLGAFNASLGVLSLALGIYGVRNSQPPGRAVVSTPLGDVSVQPVVTAGMLGLRGEF